MNAVDVNGDSPLVKCAYFGYISCLKKLIGAGADVNKPNNYKETALQKAAEKGSDECVRMLIEAGADVNASDVCGMTSVAHAVLFNHRRCLELLIEAGADVNASDKDGITSMVLAVYHNHRRCLELLIEAGADVNISDLNGFTPLMWSAIGCGLVNKTDQLKILLSAGASVNKRNRCNQTALELHISLRHQSVGMNTDSGNENAHLLLVAGERIHGTTVPVCDRGGQVTGHAPVPAEIIPGDPLCLKNNCRETIRKRLIDVDPYTNLFHKIPQLSLPPVLHSYLLYECPCQSVILSTGGVPHVTITHNGLFLTV